MNLIRTAIDRPLKVRVSTTDFAKNAIGADLDAVEVEQRGGVPVHSLRVDLR